MLARQHSTMQVAHAHSPPARVRVRVRVLLRVLPDFHLSNVEVIYLEVEHGAMQNLKGK